MLTFYIIGIGNRIPLFTEVQKGHILNTTVFSGGKRHYNLVKDQLPKGYQWILIESPMTKVFDAYEKVKGVIVVFASGNPLFYGFSNTLKNKYPNANISSFPYFSSIQLLANVTNTNSSQLQTISVHGRSWKALDRVLIQQQELIGVLTDAKNTPAEIAKRMIVHGYDNYTMVVGEDLEGEEEKIMRLTLSEASVMEFYPLNCILLKKSHHRHMDFGVKDIDFVGLPNRPKMITKMPIRLTTLHFLDVLNVQVFWDIGFCTGSVSIEAKLKNPDLEVIAFEKRPECKAIIIENQKRLGAPGIDIVMGDFFEQDLEVFPKPGAIFIGGHGGRLEELFLKLAPIMQQQTCIVINAVKESSVQAFKEGCAKIGYIIQEECILSLDEHNPITLLKAVHK